MAAKRPVVIKKKSTGREKASLRQLRFWVDGRPLGSYSEIGLGSGSVARNRDTASCTSPKCEAADCRLLSPSKSHDVWSASPGEWWVGAADCVAKLAQWT